MISRAVRAAHVLAALVAVTAMTVGAQPVAPHRALAPDSVAAPTIPVERYNLPNGLTVLLSPDRTAPIVAVSIWYHVGSKNELPGRTGFAHLFEHMMFQGSEHAAKGDHIRTIEDVGGVFNGSTNNDRTNYFETVPKNYLETVLWLESDRMGYLLPALGQDKLDNQRDVVKNERRLSVDNQPYGRAGEVMSAALFPASNPYSWPVIGSMADLSAASVNDVKQFFRAYYAPDNAVLSIAGDIDVAEAKAFVERYFGSIPRGPDITRPTVVPAMLASERRLVLEDPKSTLPRLSIAWPARWRLESGCRAAGDARASARPGPHEPSDEAAGLRSPTGDAGDGLRAELGERGHVHDHGEPASGRLADAGRESGGQRRRVGDGKAAECRGSRADEDVLHRAR